MVLKLFVFGLSIWLLYKEVLVKENFKFLVSQLTAGNINLSIEWILLVALLLLFNWALETLKWQTLIRGIAKPGFFRSYKAILTGVFVSFFTPNRIGEFAGRVLYLKDKKVEASLLTIAGSMAQIICTIAFGSLALVFTVNTYSAEWMRYGTLFILLLAALLFSYLNMDRLVLVLRYMGLPRKWMRYFLPFRRLSAKQLWTVLGYSALRYAVFSLQFIFIFKALHLAIPYGQAFQGIALMFLIQSIIPSFAFLEITGRAIAAHYAFGLGPDQEPLLLMATYGLWFINLFIPGMLGALLFLLNKQQDVDL